LWKNNSNSIISLRRDIMDNNLREIGMKMQAIGCLFTILFSIPLLLAMVFGAKGLYVGVVISVVSLVSVIRKNKGLAHRK
jgi:hypothetical protein